jgi:hypothetical protein
MIKFSCIGVCKINQITNWIHFAEKEKDKIIENIKKNLIIIF